jgi:hypothetical protein
VSLCGLHYVGSNPARTFRILSPPQPEKKARGICSVSTEAKVGIRRFLELATGLGLMLRIIMRGALPQLRPYFSRRGV